jgi:flavin-dependent dehydrogenase
VLKAPVAVAADGVNSQITEQLGLSQKKETPTRRVHYIMEGVDCPYQNAYIFYRGSTYDPTRHVNTIPRTGGDRRWRLSCKSEEGLKYFLTKGKVADWFKHAKIIEKGGHGKTIQYSPIREPVVGNLLIVGDAAGTTDVLIHGALVCGYHAGNAVAKALTHGVETGLQEYRTFWQNSIEFIKHPKRSSPRSFDKYFTEEEMDYLFKLIDNELFPGVMNSFKNFEATAGAILKHQDIIQRENSALFTKIETWMGISADEFRASRHAFSYRRIQ